MRYILLILTFCLGTIPALAQSTTDSIPAAETDSVVYRNDWSDLRYAEDSLYLTETLDTLALPLIPDSLTLPKLRHTLPTHFKPNPIRSMWLGLVLPGGGQIYNRKFWKLPIFYGGYLGCVYAFSWNSQMLRDYSQAYLDIMDDDPNTKSYMKMLPMNYKVEGHEEYLKQTLQNKKNLYRKWRDMSIFAFIAVYALSVIDAYVDAELSTFDISRDLSIHFEPTLMNSGNRMHRHPGSQGVGLQCNITF